MAGGKIDILVEPNTKGFESKLQNSLSPALGMAGKIGAALGLAVGGTEVFRDVVQSGKEFQSQLNTMAAVSQATSEQIEAVSQRARDLGTDSSLTATSASDAAAAMTELAKGGFTVEQSMSAAKGTLQLAAAAQVDAATAATIQSQALQAFSLSADDAGRVADILAGSANASSAEMTDVAQALQQAGTVANQFGVSIEDTATGIAMFANAGITGSDAGTLLKSALLALTDQGKPAQAAIKELGLEVYDAQGKFVGLESLMGQLNRASKSMSDEQFQAATATLFGSDAMRLAGIAAEQGAEGFNTLRAAVTRQGQAAEVAAAQTEGLPGAAERFSNAWEDAMLGIYDAIDDNLVSGANKAVDALERLAPAAAAGAGVAADVLGTTLDVAAKLGGTLMELPAPLLAAGAAIAAANWVGLPQHLSFAAKETTGFVKHLGDLRVGVKDTQAYFARSGEEIGRFRASMVLAGTSTNKTLQAIGRGYVNASTPLLEWSAKHKEAAQASKTLVLQSRNTFETVDHMGQQMAHSFAAHVGKMGSSTVGFTRGALAGMKVGMGNLVSFLGGPWGIAIGVASAALGQLIQSQQQAKQAALEHATQQRELKDSLDQTTGSITNQSKELIKSRLEESGAMDGARRAGIDDSTLIGAVNGRESDRRAVQAAARNYIATDVENSLAFKGQKGRAGDAKHLSAEVYADALMGIPEAIERIKNADAEGVLESVRKAVEKGGNEISALGMEIGEMNTQMDQAKADVLADNLNRSAEAASNTRQVFESLKDMVFSMPDEKTILVGADQGMTDTTIKAINDIGEGIEAVRNMDGSVSITLPEGQSIIETLNAVGGELSVIERNGNQAIRIEHNTEEVQAILSALNIQVEELPDGSFAIASNTEEEKQKLVDLGVLVRDEKTGNLRINSNLDDILKKGQQLDQRNGQQTVETHTINEVTRRITYWESQGYSSSQASRVQGPIPLPQANGSVRRAADGLLSHQEATIKPAGSWIVWAEDETEGESFIPHAPSKRHRSTQILAETAALFGLGLFHANGQPVTRDGSPVEQNTQAFANGAIRLKPAADIKRDLAYMDGTPYIMGGWTPQAVDCSGAVSLTINNALGLPDFDSRMSTTTEGAWLAAKGARNGRGAPGDIVIGWWDQGGGARGHTALALQDGTSIESGGGTGGGFTIGRGANVNQPSFTNWMHFPGEGTTSAEVVEETSEFLSNVRLTDSAGRSRTVNWGRAQASRDLAAALIGSTDLYDNGGWLNPGRLAFNATSRPEAILSEADRKVSLAQANAVALAAGNMPSLGEALREAADKLDSAAGEMKNMSQSDSERMLSNPNSPKGWASDMAILFRTAAKNADENPVGYGLGIGAQILPEVFGGLADAEKALRETRAQGREDLAAVTEAEKELAQARKELKEAEAKGGGMSKSARRKLEDAQAAYGKAQKSGNAEKISAAEIKLKRAREDANDDIDKNNTKNAEAVKKATAKASEAEAKLSNALNTAGDVASAVGGAKVAAVVEGAKMVIGIVKTLWQVVDVTVNYITDQINAVRGARVAVLEQSSALMKQIATAADDARASWVQLRLDVVRASMAHRQAQWELNQATSTYYATALRGAVDVANARARLTAHEKSSLKIVGTSVDDLWARTIAGLETGQLSFEQAHKATTQHINEKLALEAETHKTQATALKEQAASALSLLDSSRSAAKALLNAKSAASLLEAQAAQLASMQALNTGMSTPQAMRLERVTQLLAEAAMWDAKDKKEIKVEESRKYEAARDTARAEAERILAEHFSDDPQYQTYLQEIRAILDRAGHWGFWNSPEDAQQVIAAALKTTTLGKTVTALETAQVERNIADHKATEEKLKQQVAETAIDAAYAPEEARLRSEQAQWAQHETFHESAAAFYRTEDQGVKNALLDLMDFNRSEAEKLATNTTAEIDQLKTVATTAADIYKTISTDTLPTIPALPPSALPNSWRGELQAVLHQDPLTPTQVHDVATTALHNTHTTDINTRTAIKEDVITARQQRDTDIQNHITTGLADARYNQTQAHLHRLEQKIITTTPPKATIIIPPTEYTPTTDATNAFTQGLEELGFRVTKLEGNTGNNYFQTRMG